MWTNILEVCIGRDFGALKGSRLYNWKPFLGTNLLEFSIARDFGALKGGGMEEKPSPIELGPGDYQTQQNHRGRQEKPELVKNRHVLSKAPFPLGSSMDTSTILSTGAYSFQTEQCRFERSMQETVVHRPCR